nr:retrovirus-related Pol polyprotein from transposon TNT 1-94 [Tanacetum cinerariifolium]
MTGDRSQLTNFVNKFLGTVKFGNDHVEKIMGYGDYQIGNVTISRVYFVQGLGHNLFSVGQFCDSDLEVAFRQHTYFIHNLEGKLQLKADIGIFIGYAPTKKAFRIYNRRTRRIIETIHVDFDELTTMASEQSSSGPALHEMTATISSGLMPEPISSTSFVPPLRNDCDLLFEPLFDDLLTPPPSVDPLALEVITPIAEVVAQEPAESPGSPSSTTVDQDAPSPSKTQTASKTQPPVIPNDDEEDNHDIEVAHMGNDLLFVMLPAIRIFLASAAHKNMVVYQMDVKTAFLNRNMPEEVYVSQPYRIVDPHNPNHVYKLKKALYRLKQAPLAWYDMLSSFVISQDFSKGLVDPTLFICRNSNDLLLVQIYVDDIIFAASTPELCDIFSKIMCSKFKMSMMGKISFFLGLQISQSPRVIFINQSKYALESLKKYGFESCDPVDTPMVEKSKLNEDKEGKAVDPSHYRGSAYQKALTCVQKDLSIPTRNRQSGFMVSEGFFDYFNSIYRCGSCWLSRYTPYHICNNVQHPRSKHIDIIYHFIKEHAENGVIELYFVNTDYQLADIFIKALGRERIEFMINKLGKRSFTPKTLKQLTDEVDE